MRLPFVLVMTFLVMEASSQSKLQPGFNAKEYGELLSLAYYSSSIPDSNKRKVMRDPYKLEYRSPEMGLMNQWTLYLRDDNVAVINLRGTVNQLPSWLENFYAAMIPATGNLQLNDSTNFQYKLSENPRATVHTGWTIGLAHLAPPIVTTLQRYYKEKNVRDVLIFGHSQGGALAFLLRSHLEYERKNGRIPNDLTIKTYCSAAPKPGNLYYGYDFDFITRGGWAFTVVNASDWVPEVPFSVQTLQDFNPTNPFRNAKKMLKRQKFLMRIAGNMAYNKLDRPTRKAQRRFEKYFGKYVYKEVNKSLTQLKQPDYTSSNNYVRAGTPVILMPDDEYREKFPDSDSSVFRHHSFNAYNFLLRKHYPESQQ